MHKPQYEVPIQVRRSYSNSRLNYEKWQKSLNHHRAYLLNNTNQENWTSKIMSEHEMQRFFNQKNLHSQSFQMIRSDQHLLYNSHLLSKNNSKLFKLNQNQSVHYDRPMNYCDVINSKDDLTNGKFKIFIES